MFVLSMGDNKVGFFRRVAVQSVFEDFPNHGQENQRGAKRVKGRAAGEGGSQPSRGSFETSHNPTSSEVNIAGDSAVASDRGTHYILVLCRLCCWWVRQRARPYDTA